MNDRFHQMIAPNGRDLNSILSVGDINIIERALLKFMNVAHTDAAMYGMKPNDHRAELKAAIENYEQAVVAIHKLTGKNPII